MRENQLPDDLAEMVRSNRLKTIRALDKGGQSRDAIAEVLHLSLTEVQRALAQTISWAEPVDRASAADLIEHGTVERLVVGGAQLTLLASGSVLIDMARDQLILIRPQRLP